MGKLPVKKTLVSATCSCGKVYAVQATRDRHRYKPALADDTGSMSFYGAPGQQSPRSR